MAARRDEGILCVRAKDGFNAVASGFVWFFPARRQRSFPQVREERLLQVGNVGKRDEETA